MNNQVRIAIRIILGILLFSILTFNFIKFNTEKGHKSHLQKILDDPTTYDGTLWQVNGNIIKSDADFIYIADDATNKLIKILKNDELMTSNPRLDSVTVYGKFVKDDEYFIPIQVRVHKYLFLKYIISIIGLFMFLYIFFKEWKITPFGFKEARNNARLGKPHIDCIDNSTNF